MKTLTEDQILKDLEPFKHEWIVDGDWWFGSSTGFINAPLGYDINVYHNEDTNKIEAIIYDLVEIPKTGKYSIGKLQIAKESLFKFEIKLEHPDWEQGDILTPIALEEDSPFIIGTNYIVTEVEEIQRGERTVRSYTLNDHIDFRYTDLEISAYFKKCDLNFLKKKSL